MNGQEILFSVEDGATAITQLEKLANENPDKPAFVFLDKNMKRTAFTRQEIWDKSRKFAAVLRRRGIIKGDIVCNTLVNSAERIITTYGTILAGAVAMHGQTFLADGEDIIQNWKDSKCKVVILDPQQKRGAASILDRIKNTDETTGAVSYKDLPCLIDIIPVTFGNDNESGSLSQDLDSEPESYVDYSVVPDDMAVVCTTSGSTGFAKLVPHTQRSILQIGASFASLLGPLPESVYFNYRSFGWVGGLPNVYLSSGLTRVALDLSLGAPENIGAMIVQIFNEENCEVCVLLAPDIQMVLNALDAGANINKPLRQCGTGGGPLSTASMKAIGPIAQAINVVYGSTEMGLIFSLKVTDDSYENSCVGYPFGPVEFKVLGEDMEQVPAGETGEIYVRGPTTAKGYLNKPEATKESFLEDGWFRTADVGHVNAKGQLFVYCRKSNAINHKGFIHYPGWMETRINRHPDIQKSAIVGIPDPVNHEDLCLCVIKSPTADLSIDDVREFCKSLFLTSDKDMITPIPKHYLFLDSFPLNTNGKVNRKTLRADALKRLNIVS